MRNASIAIALAIATTARADGDRTLHLAVHGSIDGAALGAAIAKELGVDIALVDGTCELPCLDVGIDGKQTATVIFAPRSGSPRMRSVKLGGSTAQWPLVITLLAGNVVRDEARDLLAGLPPRDLPRPPDAPAVAEVPPVPDAAPAPEEPPEAPEIASEPPEVVIVAPGIVDHVDPPPPPVAGPQLLIGSVDGRDPPSVDAPREHRLLALGFVPGLSTDFTRIGQIRHFVSLHVLVGASGGSSGLALSGIADIQRGLVAGFQIAGIASIAQRVAGTQVAGVAAVAGELDGVQIAGTAAVADRVEGVQVGGIAAVSRAQADFQVAGIAAVARSSSAFQVGGIAATTRGSASTQAAGIAAVAGGNAGVQIGGIASVSRGRVGVQLAGVAAVAKEVDGVQIAPINIASRNEGVQIGVVNVGSAEGFSLGLINIVPGGRYDLEAAVDSSSLGTLLFRHGGRRWHNVYGVGGHPVDEASTSKSSDDVWMYGFGFGPTIRYDNTVIDVEAISWQVNHGARHESDISILGQLRLSIAHHWGPFAIVAGGALNAYVTNDRTSPLYLERRTDAPTMEERGVVMKAWPSAFLGVRI